MHKRSDIKNYLQPNGDSNYTLLTTNYFYKAEYDAFTINHYVGDYGDEIRINNAQE